MAKAKPPLRGIGAISDLYVIVGVDGLRCDTRVFVTLPGARQAITEGGDSTMRIESLHKFLAQDAGRFEGRSIDTESKPSLAAAPLDDGWDWKPALTMPVGRTVLVRTVTGLIRKARRTASSYGSKDGRALHCWSKEKSSGDLQAVWWREL